MYGYRPDRNSTTLSRVSTALGCRDQTTKAVTSQGCVTSIHASTVGAGTELMANAARWLPMGASSRSVIADRLPLRSPPLPSSRDPLSLSYTPTDVTETIHTSIIEHAQPGHPSFDPMRLLGLRWQVQVLSCKRRASSAHRQSVRGAGVASHV